MVQNMSKQLGEFLQEKQEPFTLELYLLERGHTLSSNSNGDFRCCSVNSTTKFLKKSASCGTNKKRKVIPNCSKLVKSVLNKLVTISHNQKIKNLASEEHNNATIKNGQGNTKANDDNFSSASSTTVFNSCSDTSDVEEVENLSPQAADDNFLSEKQVCEDRKLRLDFLEESKQLSPVSVLEETESSDDESPDLKKQECLKPKKLQEEFSTQSVSKSGETSPEFQYINNKKAIQQSKQLLFDCVKEVVENQKRKDPQEEEGFQRMLGAEQLWELLLENIRLWSQDSINETNIKNLMHFDLLNSFEQSSGLEEKREIDKVIGDLIFDEIVIDMFNYFS
ncbi:uncharacterized protein LOC107808935 [Nicotiana tabacum]|uniref:Uncharacterized protein LOC107808935 n=2 Tax=Nicotiana TaxID=4085 RepID=A0A1S4BJA7_TOBAC|nr:PREDICTED: uncharacterized protein LOC104228204 [Nicotiana sylvestris]XP_016488983.1 PREDICTED: uncharacterized protein LOC107808935 [Nicotiana tabacum]